MSLWEVDIHPIAGQPNRLAERIAREAEILGLAPELRIPAAARGYLIDADLSAEEAERLAARLLVDPVVERAVVSPCGSEELTAIEAPYDRLATVLPKAGVMDPVALTVERALREQGVAPRGVRTLRKFWLAGLNDVQWEGLTQKLLANDAIEQVVAGGLDWDGLDQGAPYQFELRRLPLRDLDDDQLLELSRSGQLALSLEEMRTIQAHYRELDRDPTDIELETLAQTWSEHCSHKTLAGRIQYRDEAGNVQVQFENMLKETIFAATREIRERLGDDDWLVSVFKDNAGVVRFDERMNLVFKVETHNHPSAIEPYGGANTGLGGVIRDPLGTGLGARPIANTNVFCFAPPDTPEQSLPPGVLHPRLVMQGVVAGVRDYGNRMGIPTVNGAIYFDPRYLGNPLVFCGNVGLLPRDKTLKAPKPGDWIVAVGGRTGRDGIHGATFSSIELSSESEAVSGGAVQIGNAITEKMMLDAILACRDRGLYHAITDCGAGGFSSAVGEMGEPLGAEVWLDQAPLKYEGLTYTEIWISEAQERMVLAVPPENWKELEQICAAEGVEATRIGKFEPTGQLTLKYGDERVGELSMEFLHRGRPPVVREAIYQPPEVQPLDCEALGEVDHGETLVRTLGALNVASKEWVIRQYDHEVQGGSVIKPLVGVESDGPSDAAVIRPVLSSRRGVAISCGMNPHYGDFDAHHMAASAIDEAIRNCVAVGADPSRIALLDNFCWGRTDRPETLGSLVRAALACHETAVALGAPFISGKDSLNNEFSYEDEAGVRRNISIPPTLLISALGQIADVSKCVTMDFKEPGNLIYLVGLTKAELGGSHFSLVHGLAGGRVPQVDLEVAKATFAAVHCAIRGGLVRACHDLSEGGLAVALAEMAFAGGVAARVNVERIPCDEEAKSLVHRLWSESNSRFLCEAPRHKSEAFEECLANIPHARIGVITGDDHLQIVSGEGDTAEVHIDATLAELKEAWQQPLRW